MKINLGDEVIDKITGFIGTAIARTEWINGCTRIVVQSRKLKDGVPVEPQHIDEPQLEVVKAGKAKTNKSEIGGPLPLPQRAIKAR